ncbi:acyltransferase family protein [Capillimicrobium parvum]|nr:acyltransferase family protein [Capillimicrobium parvum]
MPGLDGLRAFAVGGVLLYHAGVSWMPGGFLGVDLFFVLSGYLITSLLLTEYARAGRIDRKRFWLGRARRLLPAAVLVIVVCLIIVALFLPSQLADARADALSSLFYVNNWHQVFADRSYFATFGRPSLFQHLWSLAVEEQFYLIWPLILTFMLTRLSRGKIVAITAAGLVLSAVLMAAIYDPHGDASRVYYGTDTRAAPLLAGALLAFAWPPQRFTGAPGRGAAVVLDVLGAIGVGVLILAMVTWHDYDQWLFRGGFLVAELATVLLIAALVHPAAHIGRVFGVAPMRWIGQRSYGIYLWHWPVMALSRPGVDLHVNRTLIIVGQIALTIGLAALSYTYLEMPVRRGDMRRRIGAVLSRWRPRQRLAVVVGTAAAVIFLVGFAFGRPVGHVASSEASRPLATKAATEGPAAGPGTATTPVEHAKRKRALPRGLLAVGASVMLAAQPALQERFGPKARIDAAVGRQATDILGRLEAYRREGTLPETVVVQMGENGPIWSADVERLKAALKGVKRVVLVNVRVPRSWQAQVNATLDEAVKHWPQARVANWYGASGDAALLYDQAHPDPAGQVVYARVVTKALRAE